MKNKFFKILYKIFSFLADKTSGAKFFVTPKLFFGAMLVGAVGMSVNSCATCYEPVPDPEPEPEVTCYYIGEPDTEQTSSYETAEQQP